MFTAIDAALYENDKLTAIQLRNILTCQNPSLEVSLATVKKACKEAGLTSTRPHYCQPIQEVNFYNSINYS